MLLSNAIAGASPEVSARNGCQGGPRVLHSAKRPSRLGGGLSASRPVRRRPVAIQPLPSSGPTCVHLRPLARVACWDPRGVTCAEARPSGVEGPPAFQPTLSPARGPCQAPHGPATSMPQRGCRPGPPSRPRGTPRYGRTDAPSRALRGHPRSSPARQGSGTNTRSNALPLAPVAAVLVLPRSGSATRA